MSNMARRGFLRFIAAAPVALPVAAKEAAAGMGLQGVLGAATLGNEASAVGCQPMGLNDHTEWLQKRLAELMSEEGQRQAREDAKEVSRRLDPDLAALRSVSPSFAYSRQLDRTTAKRIESQRSWMTRDIAAALKGKISL